MIKGKPRCSNHFTILRNYQQYTDLAHGSLAFSYTSYTLFTVCAVDSASVLRNLWREGGRGGGGDCLVCELSIAPAMSATGSK